MTGIQALDLEHGPKMSDYDALDRSATTARFLHGSLQFSGFGVFFIAYLGCKKNATKVSNKTMTSSLETLKPMRKHT